MKFILNCVVLTLNFAFLESVKFRCDYRYTDIGWIKYHEIPSTWDEARLRCHLEGAVLASPTTPKMKSLMLESFCKSEIFTGIAAMFSKRDYYTIDGLALYQIPHEWAPFEPDNKNNNESCLTLNSDGKLSDVSCDEHLNFICYREHSNVDVNVCGTPDADYHFKSQTNKCYKFHTKARNFWRAHMACSAEGAHLAIINSEEEAKIVTEIFAKYPKESIKGSIYHDTAIIGYKYWHSNSEWTTVHGQSIEKAGYAKFAVGQPDNVRNSEYCGTIFRTGLLNDGNCEVPYAFFCEKMPNYPPVCDTVSDKNYTLFCNDDIEERAKESKSNTVFRKGPVY